MLETVLNLQDFKDTRVHTNNKDVPIYPILASLRGDYLIAEILSFIKYRATQDIDISKVSDDIPVLENTFRLIDTINETDEVRTQHVIEYLKRK